MSMYIQTKLITASLDKRDRATVEDGTPYTEEGYSVTDSNGNTSWVSKEEFQKTTIPISNFVDDDTIRITQDMVDKFVESYDVSTFGDKTTIVVATLKNGFVMVESSSCVNPKLYKQEYGEQICVDKIKDRVFELLGFLLQTSKHGINL